MEGIITTILSAEGGLSYMTILDRSSRLLQAQKLQRKPQRVSP